MSQKRNICSIVFGLALVPEFGDVRRVQTPFPGGLFVVIDGIDGAGKTTQCALLAQFFGERGILCALSKEPTGVDWGRKLRESAAAGRLSLEDELDYFVKDRRDHIARTIQPVLDAGGVVILDRYYYSTAAYQGARGADIAEILKVHHEFAPEPDLGLIFDIAAGGGLERVRARGDEPNAFEDQDALDQARAIFKDLASKNSHMVLVDATQTVSQLKKLVIASVAKAAIAKVAGKPEEAAVCRLFDLE
ncbi:MAG: dTMP kinase [Verrucomicrobiales bacterium]